MRTAKRGTQKRATQNERGYLIGDRRPDAGYGGESREWPWRNIVASSAAESRDLWWRDLWFVSSQSCPAMIWATLQVIDFLLARKGRRIPRTPQDRESRYSSVDWRDDG